MQTTTCSSSTLTLDLIAMVALEYLLLHQDFQPLRPGFQRLNMATTLATLLHTLLIQDHLLRKSRAAIHGVCANIY